MLEVVGVSKCYGALAAIRDVSFTARPGEVLGYLGPNGSGKATTVSMVAGLLQPSDGEIRVDGLEGDSAASGGASDGRSVRGSGPAEEPWTEGVGS